MLSGWWNPVVRGVSRRTFEYGPGFTAKRCKCPCQYEGWNTFLGNCMRIQIKCWHRLGQSNSSFRSFSKRPSNHAAHAVGPRCPSGHLPEWRLDASVDRCPNGTRSHSATFAAERCLRGCSAMCKRLTQNQWKILILNIYVFLYSFRMAQQLCLRRPIKASVQLFMNYWNIVPTLDCCR